MVTVSRIATPSCRRPGRPQERGREAATRPRSESPCRAGPAVATHPVARPAGDDRGRPGRARARHRERGRVACVQLHRAPSSSPPPAPGAGTVGVTSSLMATSVPGAPANRREATPARMAHHGGHGGHRHGLPQAVHGAGPPPRARSAMTIAPKSSASGGGRRPGGLGEQCGAVLLAGDVRAGPGVPERRAGGFAEPLVDRHRVAACTSRGAVGHGRSATPM